MVSSNDFKTGIVIILDGELVKILEFMHVKPGKGGAFVNTKLKNVRTGSIVERTLPAGTKFELADISKLEMQYIYSANDNYVFMDTVSYEQVEVPMANCKEEALFLKEGLNVYIEFYGSEVLDIVLPDKVTLNVTKADPAVAGDTKTHALKEIELETGLVIKVPMFIEQGEDIIVSTITKEYVSRAKK